MGCGLRDERIPFRRAMGGIVASAEGMIGVGDGGTGEESPGAAIYLYHGEKYHWCQQEGENDVSRLEKD